VSGNVPDGDFPPGSQTESASALEEGLRRFQARDLEGAHAAFQRAHRRAGTDARAMSWYGVTLVLVERNSNLGVLYCDQALRMEGPTPELLLNQARVALALGQRERAVRALTRGLERWPDDEGLLLAKESMGWRRRPVIPFLARSNPINRWLGKLRHRWKRRHGPALDPSPPTLGMMPRPPEE
jgi:Flp pilus assembly protein TadD